MIAEAALGAGLLAQSAVLVWVLRAAAEERRRLMHMVQSSSVAEFVSLEKAAAPKQRKRDEDTVRPEVPFGL